MFNRAEWEEHESLFHNIKTTWICYLCHAPLDTREDFSKHLELEHPKVMLANSRFDSELPPDPQASNLLSMLHMYEKPAVFQLSQKLIRRDKPQGGLCPLCAEVRKSDLTEHMARHLEEASLQILHRPGIMSLPPTNTQRPRQPRKVMFYGPKIGGDRLALEHSNSALQRFWTDIKRITAMLSFFLLTVRPLKLSRSGLIERQYELYPSFANLAHIAAHLVLLFIQSTVVLSFPFWLFLPLSVAVQCMMLLLLANRGFSTFLNGRSSGHLFSNEIFTRHCKQHDDEKWIFINSIGAG